MSILRFSCLRDTLYAPEQSGAIVLADYNKRRRTGRIQAFSRPVDDRTEIADSLDSDNLTHFLGDNGPFTEATNRLPAGKPAVVLIHGFLFDPKHAISDDPTASDNPHSRLFHFRDRGEDEERREHTTGWPLKLGFTVDDGGAEGFAVAFGWHSQPGFASSLIEQFQNMYARAYDYAGETAWPLVAVLTQLADRLPGHPLDIFCHSLGSRVVVRALALAAKYRLPLLKRIERVVVLGGSEYVVEAQLLYQRLWDCQQAGLLTSGEGPQVYNIVARENDVLDKLGENFGPRTFGSTQVIGHNGIESSRMAERWMDLQIDGAKLQDWLEAKHGMDVSGDQPGNVWDHWYYYTYPGNMKFYQSILRDRGRWRFEALRQGSDADRVPEGIPMRWWNLGD